MSSFSKKMMKAVAIGLAFGIAAGGAFQGTSYAIKQLWSDKETIEVKNEKTESTLDNTEGVLTQTEVTTSKNVSDVSSIAKNALPSIVAVTNVSYTEYYDFFYGAQRYESESAGSGIIISQDSDSIYIATNNHVVAGAESITITFCDESAVPGTVKGTDPSVDLAVVEVSLEDIEAETREAIKVASLGDSDSLTVGEDAVVIGNALGYGQSVTTGVISALSREVELQDESGRTITNSFLQTDAAVNPGNSGGALLNMSGEVIGIVSAKYSDTTVEGMGYAIPISTAKSIIEQLIDQVMVSEQDASYLGIAGVDVTADIAEAYGLPMGVYVSRVIANTGASEAGIKKGDVITSFNGRSVSSMDEISNMMQYIPAGTMVEVVVAQERKNYKEKTMQVTLTNK